MKEPTLKEIQIRERIPIVEEEDAEGYLNGTQHSLNRDEDELGWLISSITETNEIWTNAKGNKSMEIQAEINQKKRG